jgi:hypothetical protein
MNEAPEGPLPQLRYLKTLVTALTATMIVGLIILIGLVVMRFKATPPVPFPTEIALPAGAKATAVTRGPDWLAVVTTEGHILIYSADGKTLRQDIAVTP